MSKIVVDHFISFRRYYGGIITIDCPHCRYRVGMKSTLEMRTWKPTRQPAYRCLKCLGQFDLAITTEQKEKLKTFHAMAVEVVYTILPKLDKLAKAAGLEADHEG